MQCIGRLRTCFREPGGKQVIVIETDDPVLAQADAVHGKRLAVTLKPYRPPRSLSANAYAWGLISRLAAKMSTKEQVWTKNEMYQEMLSRYGEAELDESGNPKHFLAKVEIDPAKFGAACRPIGVVWQDGERYVAYESIKGSSQYDSAEMSRFLDGIISECREQGIDTISAEELERLKRSWR